ncbi:FAD-dependent monooxygenase [Legionella sp. PATHC032]|uniref:FAD-dependent oxidoreductase n=1 Tax=Legionella sp. PATHC032 TaxID=2992039 RepID=UPI001B19186D|nr:NAD(P)/FAD-dependent oxidoreductase [Legionella sp. PATHC032]MCW8420914.1 FAD-dependent monooxygenase [Legionella sp. PATHC032]HAZ7574571.1 FAD-dependent monooxygenase [Legionella pneumophila]HBA1634155.1 FAD-dependent monooxygenase [Legionella pneumophila]
MKHITIIGAGLAGTLCGLYLARRGYQVELFESRSDIRNSPTDYGRSINLALSCRGITALKAMNLLDEVNKIMVPMRARAIHEANGEVHYQPFGRHIDEYINAISRSDLNALLLNKAELYPNIKLHFNMKLHSFDIHNKKIRFENKNGDFVEASYHRLIGADGAPSHVRDVLKNEGIVSASRDFLSHGYKELSISKKHTTGMAREHLHLWPRDSFMLLGNPNPDDSITGSLFLANEGKDSFAELNNEEKLHLFFKTQFSDAYAAMPNLVQEFFGNPTGHLSTIQCSPWYYKDECLLIGDAAHGIIPFFGQGMNSAFEDCRILDELLDEYQDDWSQVIPVFYEQRKVNTDAIAKMSMGNYHEIHSDIRNPKFILQKQIERELMLRYPEHYVSMHVLVMFTNTPYAKAMAIGELQSGLLEQICFPITDIKEINWQEVEKLLSAYDKNLAKII